MRITSSVGSLLICVGAAAPSAFAIPTVSLEARSINGEVIPGGPVAALSVNPGDQLELVFRVREWGSNPAQQLRGYQCAIRYGEYFTGIAGNILPVDFETNTDPDHACGGPTPPTYGDNHQNAFVDETHPAWAFFGRGDAFATAATNSCKYRWVGALASGGVVDGEPGSRKYLGSLIVRVFDEAVGQFVIHPDADSVDGTFLRNQFDAPIAPLALEPLTIHVNTAVVSLEARAVNGVAIPGGPVAALTALPGDVLDIEFRIRDWCGSTGDVLLRGYQTRLIYGDYFSDCTGNVLPVDFSTTTDATGACADGCFLLDNGLCTPGCSLCDSGLPNANAFINDERPDFVFAGQGSDLFPAEDSAHCHYRWAAAVNNPGVTCEPGVRYYAASLRVRVSDDAVGLFHLAPDSDTSFGTFLRSASLQPIPLAVEGVDIHVPNEVPLILVSSSPPNNAIDARQPHALNSINPLQTIAQVTLTFSACADDLSPASFAVSIDPPGGSVPTIVGVTPNGPNVDLQLDQGLPPGKWTIFTHIPSGASVRIGSLPGDVNNDGTAGQVDVLKLIDHLNGVEQYAPYQTDVDRSGMTNPADILRVIDLLNGADAFDVWNGATLPP